MANVPNRSRVGQFEPIGKQFSKPETPRSRLGLRLVVSTVLLLLAAYITTYYWAEGLWFAELSFADEFWLRSLTQLGLGLFTLLTSLSICFF